MRHYFQILILVVMAALVTGCDSGGGSGGTGLLGLSELKGGDNLDFADDGEWDYQIPGITTLQSVSAMAIQLDGKLLVGFGRDGVFAHNRLHLIRLLTNGELDTSFANNGVADYTCSSIFAKLGITSSVDCNPLAIQVLPDGKIVMSFRIPGASAMRDLAVLKLNSDGSIDTSFGCNGVGESAPGLLLNTNSYTEMIVLNSGKILVAGVGFHGTVNGSILKANGTLDKTVGTNGLFNVPIGGLRRIHYDRIQDKIYFVHVATPGTTLVVTRYNSDMTLDSSYGPNDDGVVTHADVGQPVDALTDLNGNLYVLISSGVFTVSIATLGNDGALLDVVTQTVGDSDMVFYPERMMWDVGNKLIILGNTENNTAEGDEPGSYVSLLRLKSDHTIDTAFGTNGFIHAWSEALNTASVMVRALDGTLYVGGLTITMPSFEWSSVIYSFK